MLKQLARSDVLVSLVRNPDTCKRTLKHSFSCCRLIAAKFRHLYVKTGEIAFRRFDGEGHPAQLDLARILWWASSDRRPRRTCATKSIHREQNEVWQDPTRHGRCPIASMERIHGRLQAAQAGDQSRGGGPGCARDQNQLTSYMPHALDGRPRLTGIAVALVRRFTAAGGGGCRLHRTAGPLCRESQYLLHGSRRGRRDPAARAGPVHRPAGAPLPPPNGLATPQPDSRCRPNLHCDVGQYSECRSQYLGQLSHVPHGSSAILTLPVCRARSAWASRSRSFAAHASTRWLRSTSSCCSSNTS